MQLLKLFIKASNMKKGHMVINKGKKVIHYVMGKKFKNWKILLFNIYYAPTTSQAPGQVLGWGHKKGSCRRIYSLEQI